MGDFGVGVSPRGARRHPQQRGAGAELSRSRLEAATSLRQLGPRGERVIRSPRLQPAGTWALSISLALDEAQRDTGASNEMRLRQASPEDGGDGCTHFLRASLLLLLKLQVSGAGSSFSGGLGLPTFAAPTFPARLPKKAIYLAPLRGQR